MAHLAADGTLLEAWARRWAVDDAAPLWLEVAGPSVGGGPGDRSGWWSAGRFEEATRSAAGRLQAAGFIPGDRVLWSTASSVASLVAHVGALRAGLVVVPANPAYSERELAHLVTDAGVSAAIVDRPDRAAWVRRAVAAPIPVLGPALDLPGGRADPLDGASPDDPALVCYTSGTTGSPKGAVLRHRHLLAATVSVTEAWRWTAADRLVHSLPVFHAHGLAVGAYGTLLSGGSAVLLPEFDPVAVADVTRAWDATMFFGVPTMYHRLFEAGEAHHLAGLRLSVSGSAPLPVDLHHALETRAGVSVLERYGMTETLMLCSNPYEGDRRAGTVGFPLPGVEVQLAGDGEILVRGPNVFDGYWNRPAENGEVFVPADDGGPSWFRTGDLGEASDGYLTIRGRSKELIISGGFNVYPAEVEGVVLTHPGVAEVAVTGTPSPEWGEVVTAWIVPDGRAPSVDELGTFIAPSLAAYKRPKLVRLVESLPRNALGKVQRSQLGP